MYDQLENQFYAHLNVNGGSTAARVNDIVRINPPELLGSYTNGDPQNFINKIKKISSHLQ